MEEEATVVEEVAAELAMEEVTGDTMNLEATEVLITVAVVQGSVLVDQDMETKEGDTVVVEEDTRVSMKEDICVVVTMAMVGT